MKKNKFVLLVLSIAVLAFIFSACDKENAAVDNSAENTTVNSTGKSNDMATEVAVNKPETEDKTDSVKDNSALHTPDKDSPERKEIMDVLRIPVSKELKQDVVFAADRFKVQDDWAFIAGKASNSQGGDVDWKKPNTRNWLRTVILTIICSL